jgi:pilus assembly protein Flp/PilA
MSRITGMIRRFAGEEDAVAITEYGILLALLAVILVAAVNLFGTNLTAWWNGNVATVMGTTPP